MSERAELTVARDAHAAMSWRAACEAFAAADTASKLDAADLGLYATAAFMLGHLADYFALRERAYRLEAATGDQLAAARTAMWIGSQRMVMGEIGPGTGWIGRAATHVADVGGESAEAAFLKLAATFGLAAAGDFAAASTAAAEAAALARRMGDDDIATLALHQQGLIALEAGNAAAGLALLDEAMVAVSSGGLSAMVSGIVYCGVLQGCWTVYDLRRAQDWTTILTQWCEGQTDLVSFTAECKVRRAQLLELHGSWAAASDELAHVGAEDSDRSFAGLAAYARGNLCRLTGRFSEAEDEYQQAAELGYEPQPGLAQLRFVRGSSEAAAAMTRRALAELHESSRRIELLSYAIPILLGVGDSGSADEAATELDAIAQRTPAAIVTALALMARAEVDLAADRPDAAVRRLRSALDTWVHAEAPYQQARARELIARACIPLGDVESAERERAIARSLFAALGALPDLARVDAATATGTRDILSPRELDVLRALAEGLSNRAIAQNLVLSERTIDRHVSNIYAKLGVSSRAAATAYAYERRLL